MRPVESNKIEMAVMTKDQLKEILHTTVRNTVHSTLVEMGLKSSSLQSGKIYRSEMVEIIGRRAFDGAVESGRLMIDKNDPTKRNSKVYARRGEWEKFLAWNVNKKI